MNKIKLMSHLVAGYPTNELALTAARALVKGGADILEIQLPFSDPSADGPAIQTACTKVLERGYKTADGLEFISSIHNDNINIISKKREDYIATSNKVVKDFENVEDYNE